MAKKKTPKQETFLFLKRVFLAMLLLPVLNYLFGIPFYPESNQELGEECIHLGAGLGCADIENQEIWIKQPNLMAYLHEKTHLATGADETLPRMADLTVLSGLFLLAYKASERVFKA